ncbi:hypothetical protein [Sphingomonas gilva]|nr:hypothetical protein [Sphingomonas gilva]
MTGGLWGLLTILGPIVLAAVLIWAILRNRGNRRGIERTEDATRRNYAEQNAEDKARDEGKL